MVIIPARLQSTRLKNKVIAKIGNLPMVIKTALTAKEVDNVVVAVDSLEVLNICKKYKIDAVMTNKNHKSGTDRVYEASTILGLSSDEVIINLQADEPFIEPENLQLLIETVKKHRLNSSVIMNSCYKTITEEEAKNPNIVKVVLDNSSFGIYFSRSIIPFYRNNDYQKSFYGHIGIYGYTKKGLETFCNLPISPLEEIEKLEQLRTIYHSFKVAMVKVKTNSFGIDTEEELKKAQGFIK